MSEEICYKKEIKERIKKIDKKVVKNSLTKKAIFNLNVVAKHSEKVPVFCKKSFIYKDQEFINYSVTFNDNFQLTGTTFPNLMKTICHYFNKSKIQ